MSKGQNEMAKRVLLSTLNVGDKFTSDIKGGNFIITSKVGDRINIQDLDTGKETFFGSGSYMVEPISEEAPQQTYTFRQPEYMDDPEYGEKSAEEIYTESVSSRNHKFKPEELKVGKRVIDKVGGKEIRGKITVNHHDLYKDNPYTQDKKGSTVVTVVTDSGRSYDVDANDNGGEFILESRIAKGYENLSAEERAKHLLSHPSSKYMNDLKSENITERAIRKAVKEMLGKPDKRDPQFITDVNEGCGKVQESFLIVGKLPYDDLKQAYISYSDKGLDIHTPEYKKHATRFSSRQEAQKVLDLMKKEGWKTEKFEIVQEEGEAPAIANTTAEVANPDLPLKMEEDVEDSYKYQTSVAGGMGTDAENAESAKEYEDETLLIKEHKSFRKFLKESLEDDKAEALEEYKKAKAEYLANKSDENWKKFSDAKAKCMQLGVRI